MKCFGIPVTDGNIVLITKLNSRELEACSELRGFYTSTRLLVVGVHPGI
jgi:hypothetical protein